MSATIRWRPVTTNNAYLNVSTPSAFIAAMERAFGPSPWRLSVKHIQTLAGMAAATAITSEQNAYQTLIDKIENDGDPQEIEVWPEY